MIDGFEGQFFVVMDRFLSDILWEWEEYDNPNHS